MQTVEFAEAMRQANAALIAAAGREQDPVKSALFADHAVMCAVWREQAERLSEAVRSDFHKLAARWLDEAKGCG